VEKGGGKVSLTTCLEKVLEGGSIGRQIKEHYKVNYYYPTTANLRLFQ
jgi:hypothetical protein